MEGADTKADSNMTALAPSSSPRDQVVLRQVALLVERLIGDVCGGQRDRLRKTPNRHNTVCQHSTTKSSGLSSYLAAWEPLVSCQRFQCFQHIRMLLRRGIHGVAERQRRHFVHPRTNLSALRRPRVDVRAVRRDVQRRLVHRRWRSVRRLAVAHRRRRLRSALNGLCLPHKRVGSVALGQDLRSDRLRFALLAPTCIPLRSCWARDARRGRREGAEVLSVQTLQRNTVSALHTLQTLSPHSSAARTSKWCCEYTPGGDADAYSLNAASKLRSQYSTR